MKELPKRLAATLGDWAVSSLICSLAAVPAMGREPAADLVLKNGVVYTVDSRRSQAEAVAVKDGRITYVGTNDGVRACIGEGTKVLDLGGKMVLPGFIDSHCHPWGGVDQFLSAALFGLNSVEAYQKAVADFVRSHPDGKVVRGSGWSNTVFPGIGPGKGLLDEVVKDIPVAISSEDGHSTWVNSKTLELAGITGKTPDPPGGVIERDPKTGEPSGTLREKAASLIDGVIPEFTVEEIKQGIEEYQNMALALGITTSHESSLGIDANSLRAYKELVKENRLHMRIRAALRMDPAKGLEQVKGLVDERAANTGALFQIHTAKIFVDGVVEGVTAYLKEPYAHRPDFRGLPLWEVAKLNEICAELDRNRFQIHVHSIGDAATAETLDAFAFAAKANGRRDSRHCITHLQLVSPADILRFRELGVVAVTQPYWFMKDSYYTNLQVPYLGQKRADEEYPMASFFKAGVVVTSSSDYPVTIPCNPLQGIRTGMTRCENTAPLEVLWPEERVSLEQMIASFTINGAYADFLEEVTGSIEVGKSADLVVLDRKLFSVPVEEINQARVLLTLVEGREAFRHESFK